MRAVDPGSPRAARIAWLVLLIVLPVVVIFQQMQANAVSERDPARIMAPQGDEVEISARLGARTFYATKTAGPMLQAQVDQAVESADTPLQRFRAAISAGELLGPGQAAERFGRVVDMLETESDAHYPPGEEGGQERRNQLLEDAWTLLPFYQSLAEDPEATDALPADVITGLEERHGFFGELVRVAPLPPEAPQREDLLAGALIPLVVMVGLIAVIVLGLVSSLVLGIVALVFAGMGRIRFAMARPAPGGSVYLESAVVFVAGFAALQIIGAIAASLGAGVEAVVGILAMPAQWLLLLAPLWPLVRGVSMSRLKDDLGLRAPRGVLLEIWMGVVGYLALLPLMLVGVAVMLVIMAVMEMIWPSDPDAMGPTNPFLPIIESMNPLLLIMLFTLATIWAPLCEELIFRGALLRHLRGRMVLPLAAVLSAVVFGMMHGYSVVQLIPVTVLGFNFALIRAWRGSLIGPIVAHALNNAVVLSLLYALGFALYG